MTTQREKIEWFRYPEAERFVIECLDQFVTAMPRLQAFEAQLIARTNSRLLDWLDHLVLAESDALREQLADLGFEPEDVPNPSGDVAYYHPGAIFPRLLLREATGAEAGTVVAAAIQVEDIGEFLMASRITAQTSIEGTPLSPYRRVGVWQTFAEGRRDFLAVERRGYGGFIPLDMLPDYPLQYLRALERWATRPRQFDDVRHGMEQTLALARSLVSEVGTDTAAWVAFAVERDYWQRRNRAGQVQKNRQDSLGLGWANHDHHTFRSSREVFPILLQILETFGFQRREWFYAGAEAGWGAQVMEQPVCRLTVFADVDMAPDEVSAGRRPQDAVRAEGDFDLPPRKELGSTGLWCALHGESMLTAGLHHIAGCYDFDALPDGLAGWGIKMMKPFSDFPYLRQAFTKGERWVVPPENLDRLMAAGQIDAAQREQFARQGAVGSHLENIQRGEGFKGFSQQGISDIIRRTDPRAEATNDE